MKPWQAKARIVGGILFFAFGAVQLFFGSNWLVAAWVLLGAIYFVIGVNAMRQMRRHPAAHVEGKSGGG